MKVEESCSERGGLAGWGEETTVGEAAAPSRQCSTQWAAVPSFTPTQFTGAGDKVTHGPLQLGLWLESVFETA